MNNIPSTECAIWKLFLRFPIIPFFLILFCSDTLFSQPIFNAGLVITLQGDTLRGQIGEYGNNKNYQECLFRADGSAVDQRFQPGEIRGYLIENRRFFESRQVPDVGSQTKEHFIEWIIRGGTSFLKFKRSFYVIFRRDSLQRVPFQQEAPSNSKDDLERARRQWISFLNIFTNGCPEITTYFKTAANLDSDEENLIKVIKKHNECNNTPYTEYGEGLPFLSADVGVSAGLHYATVQFDAYLKQSFLYLTQPDYATFSPALGIAFFIRSPRRLSAISLVVEPTIQYFNYEKEAQVEGIAFTDLVYYHTSLKWVSLSTSTAVRYTFPNMKSNLSFQFGPVIQVLLNKKANYVEEYVVKQNDIEIITTNRDIPFEFARYQLGIGGQVNFRPYLTKFPGRLEFSLGYSQSPGITLEDEVESFDEQLIQSKTANFFLKTTWLW